MLKNYNLSDKQNFCRSFKKRYSHLVRENNKILNKRIYY